jgi:hypothetical protein
MSQNEDTSEYIDGFGESTRTKNKPLHKTANNTPDLSPNNFPLNPNSVARTLDFSNANTTSATRKEESSKPKSEAKDRETEKRETKKEEIDDSFDYNWD